MRIPAVSSRTTLLLGLTALLVAGGITPAVAIDTMDGHATLTTTDDDVRATGHARWTCPLRVDLSDGRSDAHDDNGGLLDDRDDEDRDDGGLLNLGGDGRGIL